MCKDLLIFKDHIIDDNIVLTYGNLCTNDFGTNRYDLIITTEVWEHLPCNIINVRDRVVRSMKKNGLLFVSFPLNDRGLVKHFDVQIFPKSTWYFGHIRYFTEEDVMKLFKQFSVVDKTYTKTRYKHLQILFRR